MVKFKGNPKYKKVKGRRGYRYRRRHKLQPIPLKKLPKGWEKRKGVETITSMSEIGSHREAKKRIPAGSYLFRRKGDLTVVRGISGYWRGFVWK